MAFRDEALAVTFSETASECPKRRMTRGQCKTASRTRGGSATSGRVDSSHKVAGVKQIPRPRSPSQERHHTDLQCTNRTRATRRRSGPHRAVSRAPVRLPSGGRFLAERFARCSDQRRGRGARSGDSGSARRYRRCRRRRHQQHGNDGGGARLAPGVRIDTGPHRRDRRCFDPRSIATARAAVHRRREYITSEGRSDHGARPWRSRFGSGSFRVSVTW